jgi:hypothetical protein
VFNAGFASAAHLSEVYFGAINAGVPRQEAQEVALESLKSGITSYEHFMAAQINDAKAAGWDVRRSAFHWWILYPDGSGDPSEILERCLT